MFFTPLTKFHIRWDAYRDRIHNLPAAGATALSPSEQRIQAAVNIAIRNLQKRYARVAEPLKQRLKTAIDQLEAVETREWKRTVDRLGRWQEQVTFGKWGHRLLMAALTIGEAAFNVLAFAVSGEATLFTTGLALGVSVAIPALAFAAGVVARQYEPRSRKVMWVIGLSTAALVMLFVVNELRASYLIKAGASGAPWFTATLAYFLINVGLFIAAAVITYLSKDPDADFMRAKHRIEASKRRVARLQGRLNELSERLKHEAKMYWEAGRQLIALYRACNSRGREETPGYFQDDSRPNHHVRFVDVQPAQLPVYQEASNHTLPPAGASGLQ